MFYFGAEGLDDGVGAGAGAEVNGAGYFLGYYFFGARSLLFFRNFVKTP